MKKIGKFLKQIWWYGWAKKGEFKIAAAVILAALLILIYRLTDFQYPIWWKLAAFGPGIYIAVYAIVGFIFAWIIWPISELVKWIKNKK